MIQSTNIKNHVIANILFLLPHDLFNKRATIKATIHKKGHKYAENIITAKGNSDVSGTR